MPDAPTVLLHLSDIHFRRNLSGTTFDLDRDLRDQLERDAVQMQERLGVVHGVIVSGDLGYSGNRDEYVIAGEWLQRLCGLLHCDNQNVWIVAGNHDVDRTVIEKSNQLQLLHRELRSGHANSVDENLRRYLFDDKEAGAMLFRPLQHYNSFALQFRCDVSEEKLFWEHNLILNDGSVLCLHGSTSTIISDSHDAKPSAPLVVGSAQSLLVQHDGIEYLFICHHPPDWLLDQDDIEDRLRARSRIQMFGHKHNARAFQIAQNLRLYAGATHPDRTEANWEPAYNLLAVWVNGSDRERTMEIDLYPRVWSRERLCFRGEPAADSSDRHHFSLQLPPWTGPVRTMDTRTVIKESASIDSAAATSVLEASAAEPARGHLVNPARKLTYRFMSLPYQVRIEIAQKLKLIEDEDSELKDAQRYEAYFRRARERKQLEKLWEEVERAHGARAERSENPFAGY